MDQTSEMSFNHVRAAGDIPGLFRRFGTDTHRGNYELYCREFAFATIYGNLRVNNLQTILRLLEIKQLPNIMFLIQMDDFSRMLAPYPEFTMYANKTSVVRAIQTLLSRLGIEHIVSRFLGYGTICAYLHLDGKTIADRDTRAAVTALASDIVDYVLENTGESVSIGISDFCSAHTQFPRAYTECKAALSRTFFSGKRAVEPYDRRKNHEDTPKANISRSYYSVLITLLDRCDGAACAAVAGEMLDEYGKAEPPPFSIRLQITGLFGKIIDYFLDAGLEQPALSQIALDAMQELSKCAFLQDIGPIVTGFCEKMAKLHMGSRQSPDERFRRYTNDCIERYSEDCLFGLNAIASLSNYSPSYFSRLFTKTYGMPFSRYLATYRVERAKKLLLQESLTLHEVAVKAGFCSTSYFCSVFKKKTGKSPRQYAAGTLACGVGGGAGGQYPGRTASDAADMGAAASTATATATATAAAAAEEGFD